MGLRHDSSYTVQPHYLSVTKSWRDHIKPVVLNLFGAVAHFNYVCNAIMTKLLRLSSELMAAEVISKKKVIASPVPRMVSPRTESELIYKGK